MVSVSRIQTSLGLSHWRDRRAEWLAWSAAGGLLRSATSGRAKPPQPCTRRRRPRSSIARGSAATSQEMRPRGERGSLHWTHYQRTAGLAIDTLTEKQEGPACAVRIFRPSRENRVKTVTHLRRGQIVVRARCCIRVMHVPAWRAAFLVSCSGHCSLPSCTTMYVPS